MAPIRFQIISYLQLGGVHGTEYTHTFVGRLHQIREPEVQFTTVAYVYSYAVFLWNASYSERMNIKLI